MLIGFDGSRSFVENRTGTENYSYQLLWHLAKIDQKNNYLVYLRPGNKVDFKNWPANFKFEMISLPRFWTQIGLGLETFRDPVDVLFTPAHTLPLIRKPGLKTVMTVHDLGAEFLPGLHQLKQSLYLGFISKFQLKSASKLIAVSKATKKDLVEKIKVEEEKVEVVYEGVNYSGQKSLKNDILRNIMKKYDIEINNYFLFVGTIQPRKNLERLIQAYNLYKIKTEGAKLKKVHIPKLVVVGGGGWNNNSIYNLPKKLGIQEQVRFMGRVSDDELAYFYLGATGFVYPSLFEGFGLPILEAMSLGCPVVTSNLSSMPEVAGSAAILIDPYDIESISFGMEKMTIPHIRNKMVEKGLERVSKFSWEKCAKETLKAIESTCKVGVEDR